MSPRSGPGRVKSARGGADRAVLLRGQAWGRRNDPRRWRPPWTTREPSSGECSPRPPAPGGLRLSPFPLLPGSSCLPSRSHPVRSLEPRAPPLLHTPSVPCVRSVGVVPYKSEPPRLLPPSPASAHRLSSPEVPPTEGHLCPVGHSRGAWESAKRDSGERALWGRLRISCNSYGPRLQALAMCPC